MQNQQKAEKILELLFAETKIKRDKANQEILRLKETNREMRQYLEKENAKPDSPATEAIASIEDDILRRDIILEVIKKIKIKNLDDKHIQILIIPTYAVAESYPFYYVYDQSKRPYVRLLSYAYGKFYRDDTKYVFDRFHQSPSKKLRLKREEKLKKIGDMLSISEISERFGYSYTSVYGFVASGKLKGEMINRKIYIDLEEAREFFNNYSK